jgi:hypothetical protein
MDSTQFVADAAVPALAFGRHAPRARSRRVHFLKIQGVAPAASKIKQR